MTMNCVFCKSPNVKYTCCLNEGCKLCDNCDKELFFETKYGFAPRSEQYNWINCPRCKKEIVDLTWFDSNGILRYEMSGIQFIKNVQFYINFNSRVKYGN